MPKPLAPRDLLILSVLAESALHGYGIIKAVEKRTGAKVQLDPANLYRVLRRMRRDGWIREVEDTAAHDVRRRSYALMPAGRSILRTEVDRLEALLTHVRPLLAGGEGRSL